MKTLISVFVLLWLCTFGCKAFSCNTRCDSDSIYETYPMFGLEFSKPFNFKGSKLGLNYNQYKIARNYNDYTCKGYSYGIAISHHFNGNAIKQYNSQSLEINYTPYQLNIWSYAPKFTTIGFACQIRHYDFESLTISPKIKILPPMCNLYFQYNVPILNKKKAPDFPFEIGIEINTNLPIMILGWAFEDLSKGFF